jgi:glycosyltransferase involved in cell wall biosynthesis
MNYGIDQKKFSPNSVSKDVRAELGIPADALLVLFIARFTKQKQPLAMIRAFKGALDAVPGMHLLMVGDGELRDEALRLSEELGLGKQITFQTFRQDVPDVLAAADIFVLPSLWEGLPIGLLEAMAMGKAIIASDVDGTGEVLKHERNGLLVKTGELVSSLTEALVRLGRDREMQKKFRQGAIEMINERFNVTRMAREIEDIYTNVLNKPSAKNGI